MDKDKDFLICSGGVRYSGEIMDVGTQNFFRKLGSSERDIREAYLIYKRDRPRNSRRDVIPLSVFRENYLERLARELEVDEVVLSLDEVMKKVIEEGKA